jgi:hypothetical protein
MTGRMFGEAVTLLTCILDGVRFESQPNTDHPAGFRCFLQFSDDHLKINHDSTLPRPLPFISIILFETTCSASY